MTAEIIKLIRAPYAWGKLDVPMREREYRIMTASSAVGTLEEYSRFLRDEGFDEVVFVVYDADGPKARRVKLGRCEL